MLASQQYSIQGLQFLQLPIQFWDAMMILRLVNMFFIVSISIHFLKSLNCSSHTWKTISCSAIPIPIPISCHFYREPLSRLRGPCSLSPPSTTALVVPHPFLPRSSCRHTPSDIGAPCAPSLRSIHNHDRTHRPRPFLPRSR
jgi:hypothetical protein